MFVEIILPLPLHGYFTYSVPSEMQNNISVGMRVVVNFGSKKFYTGVIANILDKLPKSYLEIKEIAAILDTFPAINNKQLRLWKWMADYYMCTEGEVMNAALPAGLKIESSTIYTIHPDFDEYFDKLNDEEYLVAEAILKSETITITDVQTIVGKQTIHKLISSLIDKKIIYPNEEIENRYTPKKQKFITLATDYTNEGVLNALFVRLEKKAPQQFKALLIFFNIAKGTKEAAITELNKAIGAAPVRALIQKGVFVETERTISRINKIQKQIIPPPIVLSDAQLTAYSEIVSHFELKKPVLLFGITGSGKTEIYIKLIQNTLSTRKQVLYLLPEIALTEFMVSRLRTYFGNDLLIYHSRFNAQEKVEIWNEVIDKKTPKIVLGARSAIFMPFSNLGLIIIDEEHDSSYKQQNPAPRYNARDSAIILSKINDANIVLGSATPSMESWANTMNGNYYKVELNKRYGKAEQPKIEIINIKQATFSKKMLGPLSPELHDSIKKTIQKKRQVILFQNRRGYSNWIECVQCGWTPTCKNCDVSMTYHKNVNLLKCHYCGFTDITPKECPACKSSQISMKGIGTQRIEDDLSIIFPEINIARMDFDSTRGKKFADNLFNKFDNGEIDVLVGTQMVTKGLDFSKIEVVGILNGDNLHSFPNFRSHETAFQTMMQVAGRAGRRDSIGKVFIQVFDKNNPIVNFVANADYEGFIEQEINSRKKFKYPPFVRLIQVSTLHKEKTNCDNAATMLNNKLKNHFNKSQILGPEYPPIARIRSFYCKNILIKLPKNEELKTFKKLISEDIKKLLTTPECKGIRFIIDVDPI